MKKRRMKTEKIKHYRVNCILHLDEKSIRLSVYLCQFNQYLRTDAAYTYGSSLQGGWSNHLSFSGMPVYPGYTGTLVIPASNRHAAKCAEIR